ncbi:mobile element transfer protein [Streptomyces sp. NBC_00005]|uniref:mobile element transfer protein n=1 Tax=Streptomyces sp. NBC_00005 TaxID=2903609 RepID=UPI00386D08F1
MPPVYTPSQPSGERSTKRRPPVTANRGCEKRTAACTAPRYGFSADYDSHAAAELAARTHRCPVR